MAYRLRSDEPLEDAIRRIGLEQVDKAIAEINDRCGLHESVHRLRKRCKKLRGLVRLVRPGFDAYPDENHFFKKQAGTFSELRDAAASRDCLDRLTARAGVDADARQFRDVAAWLDHRKSALATSMDAESELSATARELAAHRSVMRDWRLQGDATQVLTDGLEKTYKRARKAMRAAAADSSASAFHEWRKRTKYHRYHLRLITCAWPEVLAAYRDAAERVSDHLGDDHDITVFRRTLDEHRDELGPALDHAPLLSLFRADSARLRTAALSTGRRVFSERPTAFAERLHGVIESWHADRTVKSLCAMLIADGE